jgi:hypothetical protein
MVCRLSRYLIYVASMFAVTVAVVVVAFVSMGPHQL